MTSGSREKLELLTADGKRLSAVFYQAENPAGWLILVHMMPATKESWESFAGKMSESGYASIAFDIRGHGESEDGPDGYKEFSDVAHQTAIKDVESAWDFLKSRGAVPEKTFLIGASIGANLALQFLSENHIFKKAVLLSAGIDYRGIKTLFAAEKLENSQELLLISSENDDGNAEENRKLLKVAESFANAQMLSLNDGGHGTDLLSSDEADVPAEIINFLNDGKSA